MNLNDQLEHFEGRRPCVYKDSRGYQTIGVGVLVDERLKGAGLRPEEMDFIRDNRVQLIRADFKRKIPWFDVLSSPRQAVLILMAFQLGLDGFYAFTDTIGHVRAGEWKEAANAMLDSDWKVQTPRRAALLATQMETGQWVDPDGHF